MVNKDEKTKTYCVIFSFDNMLVIAQKFWFYYIVFTHHSAAKIWSSICIQDDLYSKYCILYIIRLIRYD